MKLLKPIADRFPDGQSIRNVYAVIVTLVYSWTLFTSFYKLPSWLFYLNLGEIASVYAYSFSIDLAESVLLLLFVLFLEVTVFMVLRNKDEFQARAIMVAFFLLGCSMLRLSLFKAYEDTQAFLSEELTWWGIASLLAIVFAVAAPKIRWLRKILEGFAERAVVFLYIYIPLSLISLMVVMFRNIY